MKALPFLFWCFRQTVAQCSPASNHTLPCLFCGDRGTCGVQDYDTVVRPRGVGSPEDGRSCRVPPPIQRHFSPTAWVNSGRWFAYSPFEMRWTGRVGSRVGIVFGVVSSRVKDVYMWLRAAGALETLPRFRELLLIPIRFCAFEAAIHTSPLINGCCAVSFYKMLGSGLRAVVRYHLIVSAVLAALLLPVIGGWATHGGKKLLALLRRQHVAPIFLPPRTLPLLVWGN